MLALAFWMTAAFFVGHYAGWESTNKYWIDRIKKNEIPSPENVKFWNPKRKFWS